MEERKKNKQLHAEKDIGIFNIQYLLEIRIRRI